MCQSDGGFTKTIDFDMHVPLSVLRSQTNKTSSYTLHINIIYRPVLECIATAHNF
jgi:hypothetical protein